MGEVWCDFCRKLDRPFPQDKGAITHCYIESIDGGPVVFGSVDGVLHIHGARLGSNEEACKQNPERSNDEGGMSDDFGYPDLLPGEMAAITAEDTRRVERTINKEPA